MDMMVDYFRDHEGETIIQEDILEGLPMARKTAWKILTCLLEDGSVETRMTRGPRGHDRTLYRMEDWELMSAEDRAEVRDLLEEIKDVSKGARRYLTMTINLNIQNVENMTVGTQEDRPDVDSTGNP